MDDLETMLNEACMVCGGYRCQNHIGWVKCPTCGARYQIDEFIGCPFCLEKEGKPFYRPTLKEVCSLCKKKLNDGDEVYTNKSPMCSICMECGAKHGFEKWPKVRVKIGRVWTEEDVRRERYQEKPQ
jgi:hypothetical protein